MKNLRISDFVPFLEDGTKVKIHSEIKPPLKKCSILIKCHNNTQIKIMGNSKSKQNKLGLVLPDLSNQPGQPRVSLAHDRMSPFHAENTEAVSDEVVLNWSPCTKNDKVELVTKRPFSKIRLS